MKLIHLLLTLGMLAVSGWAQDAKPEPYSPHEPYSAELVKKAEAGDAMAQSSLGMYYAIGIGVTRDEKEAVKWWMKAAEQGEAMSQFSLGNCYAGGIVVTKDTKEAVKWYTKSAEQGFPPAKEALEKLKSK